MADLFGNNNDSFDLGSGGSDKLKAEEIQKVIMMEQQKAQLNAQVKFISFLYVFFVSIFNSFSCILDTRNQ